jgi:hypothetical protein
LADAGASWSSRITEHAAAAIATACKFRTDASSTWAVRMSTSLVVSVRAAKCASRFAKVTRARRAPGGFHKHQVAVAGVDPRLLGNARATGSRNGASSRSH